MPGKWVTGGESGEHRCGRPPGDSHRTDRHTNFMRMKSSIWDYGSGPRSGSPPGELWVKGSTGPRDSSFSTCFSLSHWSYTPTPAFSSSGARSRQALLKSLVPIFQLDPSPPTLLQVVHAPVVSPTLMCFDQH